jgi:hypothetical protein
MKKLRKQFAGYRLDRLRRLRVIAVPRWVIKDEQVRMVCNRKGLRGHGNKLSEDLRIRHVIPLMEEGQ